VQVERTSPLFPDNGDRPRALSSPFTRLRILAPKRYSPPSLRYIIRTLDENFFCSRRDTLLKKSEISSPFILFNVGARRGLLYLELQTFLFPHAFFLLKKVAACAFSDLSYLNFLFSRQRVILCFSPEPLLAVLHDRPTAPEFLLRRCFPVSSMIFWVPRPARGQ